MTLSPHTRFDHYEIIAPLGKGGMGEVYRARDTRLNREVALKVLPESFANDAARLARFEQEALATSALNHPNILTVHDFGLAPTELGGAPFLVMELLEGDTLREPMNQGALPVRKAIEYAQQIAAGLAAAHEKGIVHRDLKPENLFVTKDDRVKILDFGLAKLRPPRNAPVGSDVATQKQLTSPGTVMGTVAYMSPEQVRGEVVDHRSDIFSFGLILYEMLSGQRAFQRETMAETMTAILNDEPPELSEANAKISLQLEKIVRHCLEKRPERRFQTASDLGFALEALSLPAGSNQTLALKASPEEKEENAGAPRLSQIRLWQAACLLSALAAIALSLLYFRTPTPETQVTRFSINLPKGTTTMAAFAPVLALSPNGRRIVFSALVAGKRQLWLRSLDSFITQPLSGTDDATFPFWAPDSRYVAFFADNKLQKLDINSGVIETICPAGAGGGGTWNQNGVILFSNGEGAALARVNVAGDKPEAITALDAAHGETSHNNPSFLPDGKHYLFQAYNGEKPGIYLSSLDSQHRKLLIPLSSNLANSTSAVWAPSGYILYVLNRNVLLARAFNLDRLELQGEPVRVAENVVVGGAGMAMFTVSANGLLAFLQGNEADTVQLAWCDRAGRRLSVTGPAAPWTQFRLSPDERFVALQRGELSRQSSLWLLDLVQDTTTRFITEGHNLFPVWSPNNQQLVFGSARNAPPNLFLKSLLGNTPEERLLESRFQCDPSSWSPDGKFLLFTMLDPKTRRDLWLLPLSGERKPQPLLQTKFNELSGRVSPDGHWLAYQSDESGSYEIYVTQFPQPARSWRISTNGGVNSFWRGDGKELYFVSGNKMMAVSVTLGTEVQSGLPQPLFEIEGTNYAPSKDGQRFLIPVVTEKAPTPPINVVLNWTADLKK